MPNLQRDALLLRAQNAFRSKDFFQSQLICEELLAANGNDVAAMEVLAKIHFNAGRFDDSIDLLRRCAAIYPKNVHLVGTLGAVLAATGRFDDGLAQLKRALTLDPENRDLLASVADALEKLGQREDVRRMLDPFVRAGTDTPQMARSLALAELADDRPDQAVALLRRHTDRPGAPAAAYFALGKAYEKLGDAESAFDAYATAKRLVALPFNLDSHIRDIDDLIEAYSSRNLARLPRATHGSRLPVFVTGRPRSGTTLVAKIIAAHSQGFDAGENQALPEVIRTLNLEIGSSLPYPQAVRDIDAHDANVLGEKYLASIRRHSGAAVRAVDKTLNNVNHLGLIELVLPESCVIHCRRNPVDTCLACFSEDLGLAYPFACTLHDLGVTHAHYERLMDHYRSVLRLRILDVDYEEIVANPEGMTRRILEFIGLPWDDRCMQFHVAAASMRNSVAMPTLSYDQVRRPVYTTSVGRAAKFAGHLQPLYDALEEGRRQVKQRAASTKS